MDERVEKAFDIANYMATLSNQRRLIQEEFNQKLVYYIDGATFKVTPELINFTKNVLDIGHTTDVPFLDANSLPVNIADVKAFLENLTDIYFSALNTYAAKFAELNSKRRVEDLVSL